MDLLRGIRKNRPLDMTVKRFFHLFCFEMGGNRGIGVGFLEFIVMKSLNHLACNGRCMVHFDEEFVRPDQHQDYAVVPSLILPPG